MKRKLQPELSSLSIEKRQCGNKDLGTRVQWLAEGDCNTHFFHRRATRRRQKNKNTHLSKPDGAITTDLTEMGALTGNFFIVICMNQNV